AFVKPYDGPAARIGITATRKVGNSVVRNRCRRLVREVFRKNKWRIPASVDIVVNVKSALIEAGFSELETDFLKFLEKCKWEGSSKQS
ncbi:MAG: ribonuclease P protein component, partial [Blastocatellia bacterium]